jgi:hypothetical protein
VYRGARLRPVGAAIRRPASSVHASPFLPAERLPDLASCNEVKHDGFRSLAYGLFS